MLHRGVFVELNVRAVAERELAVGVPAGLGNKLQRVFAAKDLAAAHNVDGVGPCKAELVGKKLFQMQHRRLGRSPDVRLGQRLPSCRVSGGGGAYVHATQP